MPYDTLLYYTMQHSLYYTTLHYTIHYTLYTIYGRPRAVTSDDKLHCSTNLYFSLLFYTRLCRAIPYYTILCNTHYTTLHYTIHYTLYTIHDALYTIHDTIPYDTLLYYTMLHSLYHTTLHYTILFYTILYYTILYYTILYSSKLSHTIR
jgi:hypothetical protein